MANSGKTAIQVKGLGKRYRIGEANFYPTLRETLAAFFTLPHISRRRNNANKWIWALRDIDFCVHQGEVLGIIGRNGAGKSTLLKVLAGITEPTAGYADICGRVGSLLEVGTGFHPELTGRENIFLNGAMLGMRRKEIKSRFAEIVAFSEIEEFLDTPVKRYSSGMYMRLAFAVAAHLEPEILIVDEVLSVGDVLFQKKCLGKMRDISQGEGRTVLFVSHNMDAIQRLCSHCLLLDQGKLIASGNPNEIVLQYISAGSSLTGPREWIDLANAKRTGTGEARFVAIKYSSLDDSLSFLPYSDGPLEISLLIDSDSCRTIASLAVTIYSRLGNSLVNADIAAIGEVVNLKKGRNAVKIKIEHLHLNPGLYPLGLWLHRMGLDHGNPPLDYLVTALRIEVVPKEIPEFGIKEIAPVSCKFNMFEIES